MATGYERYGSPLEGTPSLQCGGPVGAAGLSPAVVAGGLNEEEILRAQCGDAAVDNWAPDFAIFHSSNSGQRWFVQDQAGANYAFDVGANDFSIEAWLMLNDNVLVNPYLSFNFFMGRGLQQQYLQIEEATGLTANYTRTAGVTANVVTAMPTINTWHYVVINFDRSANMELFVDNISQGAAAIDAVLAGGTQGLAPMQYVTAGGGGSPFYLSSFALHAQLMNGAERLMSYNKKTIRTMPTTFCAYRMRDTVFTAGSTGLILNATDEGADAYANMGGATIGNYSCVSRRGIGTDLFTVFRPDLSANGLHDFQPGIDTVGAEQVIRYAADEFFWRSP